MSLVKEIVNLPGKQTGLRDPELQVLSSVAEGWDFSFLLRLAVQTNRLFQFFFQLLRYEIHKYHPAGMSTS
jgi:hypothetical protein